MTEAPTRKVRRESQLRLRRPADIALAFVFGPAAGLTVLWLLILIDGIIEPRRGYNGIATLSLAIFYAFLLIVGGVICLFVELVFITPLLIGFHCYRWRWLNGWTLALIGFVLAFTPALLLVALSPPTPGNLTDWGMATLVNGHRTAAGWALTTAVCAVIGLVGVVAAGVFRLLAMRRVDGAEAAS